MRICFIADAISIHVQRQANFFAQEGHEVHLISTTPSLEGYDQRVKHYLLRRVLPQLWWLSKYLNAVIWLFQVRRIVSSIKPNILNAHYITGNGYLGLASGFRPFVLTVWGSDILVDPRRSFLIKTLTGRSLKKADSVVCRTSTLGEEVMKFGVSPDKIRGLLIGVDTSEFQPQPISAHPTPVIISTRSLSPLYDVETLIKAIPLVLAKFPHAQFVVAGKGQQQDCLRNLSEKLGIANSVKFMGWVLHRELPTHLASADIYVSTSLSDGASNSLFEAMASGLAPIVTDIPANRAWIKPGENGLLFPVRESETLAEKIIYLLKNRELRKTFGKRCREIVRARAEYRTEMKKLEAVYQDLVKNWRQACVLQ